MPAAVAAVGAALAAGLVSGEHVDALTCGLKGLNPAQRQLLAGQGEQLVARTKFYCALSQAANFPTESRVTVNGRALHQQLRFTVVVRNLYWLVEEFCRFKSLVA